MNKLIGGMRIDNEHSIGDIVFLKTDIDQQERMVTAITIRPGTVVYELSCGDYATEHYSIEISKDKTL